MCKLQLEGCTGKSETADHIITVEAGGSNRPDNLRGACHACNWKRGSRDVEAPQEVTGADLAAEASGGTQILFDGSEKPSHRVLLEGMGVKQFAWSFWRASRRGFPKTKPYLISDHFEEDAEVFVDSGWMQAQEKLTGDELDDYVAAYDEFLENNLWRLSGATEMHLESRGMGWINQWREDHEEGIDEGLIWPIWLPEHGQPMLFTMSRAYDNVALPNRAMDDTVLQTRLGALQRQLQTNFHALNVATPDTLRSVPLATASTISWASPQMRGETIVWDGNRLVRYQAKMKQQARSRYKAVAERAGLDHAKIVADDANEVTKLAIWSYLQLEKSMLEKSPFRATEGGKPDLSVNNRGEEVPPSYEESGGSPVDSSLPEVRNEELPVAGRKPKRRMAGDKQFLPVFAVEEREEVDSSDGSMTLRKVPVLASTSSSLRQCNTCVISGNCPAFTPDSECAFELPVEVRTKDQLRSVVNSMIELQGQRVAFAKFAEDVNGGYPDPNLSQEIDRFFRLVKNAKDLEQNNEFMRISVERQTSGGVLSQIFGERAQTLSELEKPVDSEDVITQVFDPGS